MIVERLQLWPMWPWMHFLDLLCLCAFWTTSVKMSETLIFIVLAWCVPKGYYFYGYNFGYFQVSLIWWVFSGFTEKLTVP